MKPDWSPLDLELTRWRAADLCLPLWWRDDDAVVPSPALDRLTALARALEIPVHLAVIPQGATQELADYVRDTPCLIPVVHGWAHRNHAPEGDKRAEFSPNRPLADMQDEAAQGLAGLSDLFADRLAPIFVPPWNRIAPRFTTELAGLGYRALSTFTPRESPFAAPGLARINTHLDPINWKAGRALAPTDALIAQVTGQLADRRRGRADNGEPYGILTHHLVHDDATWAFTDALISRLMSGPCRLWSTTELTRKDTTP